MVSQGKHSRNCLVVPLRVATVRLDGRFNPPEFVDTRISVFAFLLPETAIGPVLVDSGVGVGVATVDQRFEPERFSIPEHLAAHGLTVSDVQLVINSHLHFDHCGNNALFEDTRVLVQSAELSHARALGERYTVPQWVDHGDARLRTVDGDHQVCEGLKLLFTPGHTPGHQSILVGEGERQELIVAQASFSRREFLAGGEPEAQADAGLEDAYRESVARLGGLSVRRHWFSHDGADEAI